MQLALCLLLTVVSQVVGVRVVGNGFAVSEDGSYVIANTLDIDPTKGTYTIVAENFYFSGWGSSIDGVSAFDQKRKILYYATDTGTSLVYSVNVDDGTKPAIIDLGDLQTSTLIYDNNNDQLLMVGEYNNDTNCLFSFSRSPQSSLNLLTNFTTEGITRVERGTISDSGILYFTYIIENTDPKKPTMGVASMNVSTPTVITKSDFPCKELYPNYLYYNTTRNALTGIASTFGLEATFYFEISNGECTATAFKYPGGILNSFTYDYTTATYYMGCGRKYTEICSATLNSNPIIVNEVFINTSLPAIEIVYE